MKKKHILLRFIIGFGVGVLHGALVVYLVSIGVNGINGDFMAVMSGTVKLFGSENLAVTVQTLMTGMLGVDYAMAAMIYENPKRGFLAQSLLHFAATFPYLMAVAYVCWIPVETQGYISLTAGIAVGYVINFVIQYVLAKRNVREINDKMESYVESLEDSYDSDKNRESDQTL